MTLSRLENPVIIGCGKMGEALLSGWLASNSGAAAQITASSICVVEPGETRREALYSEYQTSCVSSLGEVKKASMIVLAVKPQVIESVLNDLAQSALIQDPTTAPLVVSIAAGIPTARIEAALGKDVSVVRVMPNTPLMVCAGASVVAGGVSATSEDVALVKDLFAALGYASVVKEDDIDVVCALSGGGPAYVARFIESLRDAAVGCGLDGDLAEALIIETVAGTCKLMKERNTTPEQTRIAVCSPGGTTLAALDAMTEHGFEHALEEGVKAAIRRSKELASC